MDFENFVASIVREKFQQIDEEAADAREQQGIAQVGLGTRPMSDRPGLAKEEDEVKTEKVSTATRVISDMSDYYQPEEFPTQEVRIDNAPRFSNINKSTVLDILSANRDGLEKQGIIKMPMGMLRQPDPTLDIDGLQSRILDKLDLRPPEGSEQDIQYAYDPMRLAEVGKVDDENINVDVSSVDLDMEQLDSAKKDTTQQLLNRIALAEGADPKKLKRQTKYKLELSEETMSDSPYDMVLGYGKFAVPKKNVSKMTMAELYEYQKKLINATKGKIPGDERGSSASGKYQVTLTTLFGNGTPENPMERSYADRLNLTPDTVYSPELQERIGFLLLKDSGYNSFIRGDKTAESFMDGLAVRFASIQTGAGEDFHKQGAKTTFADLKPFFDNLAPTVRESGVVESSPRPRARPQGLMSRE
jgi:hypothetical protein